MQKEPVSGIAPGGTGAFTLSPVDRDGNPAQLPAGLIPTWTSSDPDNAPVTPAADGLSATVTVASGDVATNFALTVTAPLPDGSVPQGSVEVPVLQPAPLEVASFIINQTS